MELHKILTGIIQLFSLAQMANQLIEALFRVDKLSIFEQMPLKLRTPD